MENILSLQLQFNNDIMATVTINYDSKNVLVSLVFVVLIFGVGVLISTIIRP